MNQLNCARLLRGLRGGRDGQLQLGKISMFSLASILAKSGYKAEPPPGRRTRRKCVLRFMGKDRRRRICSRSARSKIFGSAIEIAEMRVPGDAAPSAHRVWPAIVYTTTSSLTGS